MMENTRSSIIIKKSYRYKTLRWLLLLNMLCGCVEPYDPPVVSGNVHLLVVDGFLDVAAGNAEVRLTHTTPLSNDAGLGDPELQAEVTITSDDGTEYPINEVAPGIYYSTGITIDPARQYRLHVRTVNAVEFVSDPLSGKGTPAIDSLTWSADQNGVTIKVNTHDPTGQSRYYRWDYVETWQYRAPIASDFKLVGKEPVYRTDAERITNCWQTSPSTEIVIGSSARLVDDVIRQQPVRFLPRASGELSIKYSILVRQRVIDKAEYSYLEQLRKSTESLGGLFDPQPSQLPGNVHSLTNSNTTVLGYFSVGAYTEERIFIDFYDLPKELQKKPLVFGCDPDTLGVSFLPNLSDGAVIGSAIYSPAGTIIAYTISSPRCADCRTQGGVTTKPIFWQ